MTELQLQQKFKTMTKNNFEKINNQPRLLQQFLYQEMKRLTLMVDKNLSSQKLSRALTALVTKAKNKVNSSDPLLRLLQLCDFFYHQQGFYCNRNKLFDIENLLIHKVLETKSGMSTSLSAILLYLASKLEIDLFLINFPIQTTLRSDLIINNKTETIFINPYNGQIVKITELQKCLEAEFGYENYLTPHMQQNAKTQDISYRAEVVFKTSLSREKNFETMLQIVDHRLQLNPDDIFEIRDRGFILAQMECYNAAIEDLKVFVDNLPQDPSTITIKQAIKDLKKRLEKQTLH